MENGVEFDDGGNLTRHLSNLSVNNNNGYTNNNINGLNKSDGLFQVMKAVEAAEATIEQQVKENHRLRSELQKKIQELENYRSSDTKAENSHPIGHWNDHGYLPQAKSPTDGIKMGNESNSSSTLILNKDFMESQKINGVVKIVPSSHTETKNLGMMSHFTSPSATSFSPSRYQPERDYDPQFNVSGHGHGIVSNSEIQSAGIPLNQAVIKTRDQEQEILLLRKHLANYSVKKAQIHNEKIALEKRIAYMRLAFDQQQQDLVDATSKALSYRQDIIEENIHLTYALQDAQDERTTFVSSLMPLLTDYSLQPPVVDALSIVSNVKVLFRHLQEKVLGIETKLKESQYQLAGWRSDVNPSSFAESPLYSFGNKSGLELVPQQAYSDGQVPISLDRLTARGWNVPEHSGGGAENLEPESGRYSPLINRNDHSLGTNAHISDNHGHYVRGQRETLITKR